MGRKKKFKSIENYRKESKRINDLLNGLLTTIKIFQTLPDSPLLKDKKKEFKKLISNNEFMIFDKERIDNIYELFFIRLFASFEAFMYEYLKELYIKYPNSIPTEKKIEIGDILDFKTKKSVTDFIIDHIAIENSYDHITWEKTLKNQFGKEVFKDKTQRGYFHMLSVCRNMLIHSSGKTNSKVMKDFNKLTFMSEDVDSKKPLFKVEKWDIYDEKLFAILKHLTNEVVDQLEKNST